MGRPFHPGRRVHLSLFDDFYGFLNQNRDVDINTDEIVFLGYGIHDKEYSDYEGKNVANKVIVILDGEPMRNGISVITGTETRSEWSAGNADKIRCSRAWSFGSADH